MSDQIQFAIGDAVYLKSGSCRMTVEAVSADNVRCVWQNYETKAIMRENFILGVLVKRT